MRNLRAGKEMDGAILPPIVLAENIGPYRIEERLGGGGMGEVYRAYDHRLERRVAVKVIRPEAGDSSSARERFRREARAAAGLAHPSVVQIFDIVERPEGDCIVMELVEGETLRRHLADGRPPLLRAVHIAREVAEGLAAAHARGLVHRDLKTENVMITPEGRAKILDFGLAKRTDSAAEDLTVSVQGHVLGTSHAMSPEQAQGQPVDHRSDLFSFGSLLYELLTGEAPFRRDSLAQTLTWVCTRYPEPAHEVVPGVPQALSALVDHLMEKDPADRPESAAAVAAVLAHLEREIEGGDRDSLHSASIDMVEALRESADATRLDLPRPAYGDRPATRSRPATRATGPGGSAASARSAGWGGPDAPSARWTGEGGPGEAANERRIGTRRRAVLVVAGVVLAVLAVAGGTFFARTATGAVYVAVPAPAVSVEGDVPGGELLPSAIRVALLQELLSLEGITALAPDQVDAVGGTSVELARALAADEVVTARLACEGTRCWATLERVRGEDGSLIWMQNFEVEADDLLRMSNQVGSRIRTAYGSRALREEGEPLDIESDEYEEFLRIREAFQTRAEGADLEMLLSQTERLRRRAPRFVPAYLLEAEVARARYTEETRNAQDLERAFSVIEEARRLAPRNSQPLYQLVDTALEADRLDQAENALDELARLGEDEAAILARRAQLVEKRGQAREALRLMRGAARRRPSERNLLRLAQMEARQGEMDQARRRVADLLERAPDSFLGQELRARIELMNGNPVRAAALYEEMLEHSPGSTTVLNNLGVAYQVMERYEDAARVARALFEQEPNNPFLALNLADAEALAGHTDRSRELYRRVLDLTEQNPVESDWQILTVRAQAKAHLGDATDAVALVQRALQAAPENAQAAYEAALVYALVGEARSAAVSIERALRLGVEPGWFESPWFDELRKDPEIEALLANINRTGAPG